MLDLDNIKQVNDRFGHATGDAALKEVAAALKASKRDTDSVFRWGGDEFVVLLPEVRPEAAHHAMQRLLERVSAIDVQGLKLGASVGLASYPTDGLDAEGLLHRADGRMYEKKAKADPTARRTAGRKPARAFRQY
jgi:diguanylate cyclase (GGDEF)-like protein